jgi:hypothetical protein
MQEAHRKAAEQHELAAREHRTAAECNDKLEYRAAIWHSERALEYSDHAYKLAHMSRTVKPPNYTTEPRMPIVSPSSRENRIT